VVGTDENLSVRAYDPVLDSEDPGWRDRFHIPAFAGDPDSPGAAYSEVAYFAGNSLGLQPTATRAAVDVELERWAEMGVEGQLTGPRPWKDYHEALRDPAARLVGALPHETVIMNSLTVNLHVLMATFYRPEGRRTKIVMEDIVFPSDGYAMASQARWHGLDPAEHVIRLRPREGEDVLRTDDVIARIRELGDEVAVVVFSAVNYLTGEWMDMPAITAAGHEVGAWDLAHAAGNVPLRLHDWNADFAAWCSYKYLNSGPGSLAGAFIHARHVADPAIPRLEGWWSTREEVRFAMGPVSDPPPTADAWAMSNPPIFAMGPVRTSLAIFDEVGMEHLRVRSLRLGDYLWSLLEPLQATGALAIVTPREHERRGSQLSIRVSGDAADLTDRLRLNWGVVADERKPDIVRLAPAALYCSYLDCWRAADALAHELIGRPISEVST